MSARERERGVQLSDGELARRASSGDAGAWEAIVGRHQEAVFRYAYLQLGDPAEAEDVAQETFVRAFRSFARFDIGRPLRPWLLRIARNLARNRWRSWSRRLKATERWKRERDAQAAGEPDGPAISSEAAQDLRRAVDGLSDQDRQIVYLRFFLGLSLEETGETLALPAGTVKSRQSRALDRLRQIVQRDYPMLRQALEP